MHHYNLPTQEFLLKTLEYDEKTGLLFWRTAYGRSPRKPGQIVRIPRIGRYTVFPISEYARIYRASRIIWRMQTGEDPGEMEVDHEDREPSNDRWSNLRLMTRSENEVNTKIMSNNTSGIKGVWPIHANRKWGAKLTRDTVTYFLGWTFETKEEAGAACEKFLEAYAISKEKAALLAITVVAKKKPAQPNRSSRPKYGDNPPAAV